MRRARYRLLRVPAIHFLILGGLLFAIGPPRWSRPPAGERERGSIVITAADACRLAREWTRQHGSPPSASEARWLFDNAIDEELLYREALALGFHRADPVVRVRLVRLARSLGLAPTGDETLEGEARALGFDRSDELVRRHLVEMMRLAAAKLGPSDLPAESELRDYHERHPDRFRDPARVRLTHVYMSFAQRGTGAEEQAIRLLSQLRAEGIDPQDAPALGDAFIRGPHVSSASSAELERIFGPEFAHAIERIPPRAWAGPIRSSYGVHLAWIHERIPARLRPLESVRNQVLHALLRERAAERFHSRMRTLRARYRIELPLLDGLDVLACQAAPGTAAPRLASQG